MKRILLPTDFSENSWNAISYALQLLKNQTCDVILLNTYTPAVFTYEYAHTSSQQLNVMDAVKETSKKNLDTLLTRIETEFTNPKHTFTLRSSFNTLTAEINELNENIKIDVIIMGTQGATGVKEILLGSNTVHVIKTAKCPVLAVPSGFAYESPHEILFPTDLEIDFENSQIHALLELAKSNHSRVNAMHVILDELSKIQTNNKHDLEKMFEHSAFIFHSIKRKNILKAIDEFQLKHKINLLVMINNKHSFFENIFFKNTINQIGFHLNIPFLVIPSKV